MKRVHAILAAVAMIFLIFAVLITCFQAAVYADPEYKYYEKEYQKYNVTADLDMEMKDVMKVTDYMMAYLIGEEEELSIETTIAGEEKDFFNDQDRSHMADVKNLFLGGLKFRNICGGIFLVLLVVLILMKANIKRILPRAYNQGLFIFLVLTGGLGLLFASDFTKYFTIFHEIFFTNDLWLFDPATDYMIRMLPEGFFADMTARIGVVFISALVVLWFLFFIWKIIVKKQDKKILAQLI